ncbi:MAG: IclR family transcriptional regulator [Alicyclobacillus shizuokensis]|nr:IclR family transcriptional regulator [Alicyclobacillus shizuokensis]
MDYLAHREPGYVSMQQMSRDLKIPRPTLYRLLDGLVDVGMLIRLDGGYHVGPKVLTWASKTLTRPDIVRLARPSLEKLADESALTSALYVRMGSCRVCMDRVEGSGILRHDVRIGESLPLHVGSSGRVLLAWLPAETREELLQASCTEFPQYPLTASAQDFSKVVAQGWALSLGERDEALASLGAPIFSSTGEVTAAISLSGVRQRFTDEKIQAWRELLLQAAAKVSTLLGAGGENTPLRT